MDVQSLRLFADVARLHSFSEAAQRHGVTQSAASQRVSALEKRLGVTLIDRSVRPPVVTEAGRVYLAGVEDVLARLDRLEARVRAMSPDADGADERGGTVRVAAIYSAGIGLLNRVRERFEAEHPRVQVEIRYEQPHHVHAAVLAGEADLGIVSYPRTWKRVATMPLRDEVMAVVCRPDHPLAKRKAVRARDLVGHKLATFEVELPVGRQIRQYLREQGVASGVEVASVFDNIDTIKSAVEVTDQFSILPRRTVIREVTAGTLAVTELTPGLTRPMGIIARKPRGGARAQPLAGTPPSVRAFVEFLVRHAGPDVDLAGAIVKEGRRQQLAEAR